MRYQEIKKARFLSRPNRFIAYCEVDGACETVHVKNTGRCRELLVPDATVYLSVSDNPARKTKYDLVAVEKETDRGLLLINMDSQAPNEAAYEWLSSGGLFGEGAKVRREVTYGNSRFDLYVEQENRKAFVEVKGVTLEKDGVASFPDAPTERGIKHLEELVAAMEKGYDAYILFVIQMKGVHVFTPNDETHKAFGETLRHAAEAGVQVLAYDCTVTPDEMTVDNSVKIRL
ncbi:MAG: DNA/RNA nuclease SfsA [Clostridia bacterium]|nr:DNA/RNA nuclease SfsA [Clostridia bacterium]